MTFSSIVHTVLTKVVNKYIRFEDIDFTDAKNMECFLDTFNATVYRGYIIDMFKYACKHDNLEIADFLSERYELTKNEVFTLRDRAFRANFFVEVFEKGYLRITEFLVDKFKLIKDDFKIATDLFFTPCRGGNLELIKWFIEKFNITYDDARFEFLFQLACESNRLEVAQYLTKRFDLSRKNRPYNINDIFDTVCRKLYVDLMEWMYAEFELLENRDSIIIAFIETCKLGDLQYAIWISDQFQLTDEEIRSDDNAAFRMACQNGDFELIEGLIDRFNFNAEDVRSDDNFAFRKACEDGNIELAEWLTDRFDLNINDAKSAGNCALLNACRDGNLELVKWLFDKFELNEDDAKTGDNTPFCVACKNGYLELAQWLAEKFNLTSQDASTMDNFAYRNALNNGHFEVTNWLEEKFGLK